MRYGRAAPHPTLSCTELGLQCPTGLLRRRWSLTPPFHPYHLRGGIFSVALSIHRRLPSTPRPFKRNSALWCSDFPLAHLARANVCSAVFKKKFCKMEKQGKKNYSSIFNTLEKLKIFQKMAFKKRAILASSVILLYFILFFITGRTYERKYKI